MSRYRPNVTAPPRLYLVSSMGTIVQFVREDRSMWKESDWRRYEEIVEEHIENGGIEVHGKSWALTRPGANLSGFSLSNLIFHDVDLTGANLEDADFSLCTLLRCSFVGANLARARFAESIIEDCDFSGLKTRIRFADFFMADVERCDFSSSNAFMAQFVHSRLKSVVFQDADLRQADFERCEMTGVRLRGARLEGASFLGVDLSNVDKSGVDLRESKYVSSKPIARTEFSSYGRMTGPVIKSRRSEGQGQGYMERHYPREAQAVKGITRGSPMTKDMVATVESSCATMANGKRLVWTLTRSLHEGDQRSLPQHDNWVLLFNIDVSSFRGEEAEDIRALSEASKYKGHPFENFPLFTVGWVRYYELTRTILIEEVQSDVDTVRIGFSSTERQSQHDEDAAEAVRKIAAFKPYADAFYFDAIGTIFMIAAGRGMHVEMLSHEQKKRHGSPRSVYEDLPRKMGMRPVESSVPGVHGKVWAYTPNRRRR